MKFELQTFSKRRPPIVCAVFVIHEPHRQDDALTQFRGTAAAIVLPDLRYWVGISFCAPGDQFHKKHGKAIALGRAVQKALRSLADGQLAEQHDPCEDGLPSDLRRRMIEAKKDKGWIA